MHESQGDGAVFVFTRDGVRRVDAAAIKEFGLPGVVMMENAATALANVCLSMIEVDEPNVVICCGPGNNGGDGFALARRLHNAGVDARLLLADDPDSYSGDAATNLLVARRMEIPAVQVDGDDPDGFLDALIDEDAEVHLLVDALFGTGLTRAPEGPAASMIRWMNRMSEEAGVPIVAVDVPSGLDCDSGAPLGDDASLVVRADVTVSLAGAKRGFFEDAAAEFLGEILVADIGAPRELLERYGELLESGDEG